MGFFEKIKNGLKKTRAAMANTLGGIFASFSGANEEFYEELEESMILADIGVETSCKAVEQLRTVVKERKLRTAEEIHDALKDILVDMLNVGDTSLKLGTRPSVVLVIGVNGVGKTTTIGKLAHRLSGEGKRVLLCAADTFRAAAADQLEIWAGVEAGFVSGADIEAKIEYVLRPRRRGVRRHFRRQGARQRRHPVRHGRTPAQQGQPDERARQNFPHH